MNDSHAESRLVCRLCSNKSSLISLFRGKNLTVRDFIRKIVAVAIGVKYEEDDYFDCICSSCVCVTFNLFVFKTKSQKNQERLQALVPKRKNNVCLVKKLSDIELPHYTSLKQILLPWLFTKAPSDCTDKSSTEGSTSTPRSKEDKKTQTCTPKTFNTSIQTILKPAIPKVSIETQTHLIESDSQKKTRTKNRYTQCDLVKLKEETKKPVFNVSTQTIDLSDAIITRKCDNDKYNSVNKTLNSRITHTDSDRTKSKKLKNKLELDTANKIKELFEPLATDKAAVGLEFTLKKKSQFKINLSESTTDSSFSKSSEEENNSKTQPVRDSVNKSATYTLTRSSKKDEIKNRSDYRKDESENVRPRKKPSSKSDTLTETDSTKKKPFQFKETLSNITKPSPNTKDSKKSESISKTTLNEPNEGTRSGLLTVAEPITSPQVKEADIIEIASSESNKTSSDHNVYNPLTIDCQKPGLPEVKVEWDSPGCLDNLGTPSITLKTSPLSVDDNDDPSLTTESPNSSGLLQDTGKVDYLKTCLECGMIIHTKNEMVKHRKIHMKCHLCKKRFWSIKKTKEHMIDCRRKVDSTKAVIPLTKIELCKNLQMQYPSIVEQLSPKKKRKIDSPEPTCSKRKLVFRHSTISE